MDDDQQFCLRWNNHQSTLVSVFDTLLEKGMHVDCTLAAEGQTLKAHKVVLSACSPYFESVLSQQYDKHPIIILKDVKYAELRAMMDYMYRGEVNISQDQLAALLKAAESLQIKGLSDNKPSRPPSRPAPATAVPAPVPAVSTIAPSALVHPHSHTLTQSRDESLDSREGSASPTRRRKKVRRLSADPAPTLPPVDANGETQCKEEPTRDGVEDLTIDEDVDGDGAHNDVVRNFQWHMERSQDELMNSNDSMRDSQELAKELPSALLSLLGARGGGAAAGAGGGGVSPALPLHMDTLKAHILQQAFLNNNRAAAAAEPSDNEYDDTDDIVLPEEGDALYDNPYSLGNNSNDSFDLESKGRARREGSSSDDASRHFECRHCGKRYRWKSTLRRHENVECGGKAPAHQCPYCSYRAKQRGNLGVHIRKHHNTEWYSYATNKVRKNKKTPI